VTDRDPHAELAALAAGLEAHAERARRRGVRRLPAPAAAAPPVERPVERAPTAAPRGEARPGSAAASRPAPAADRPGATAPPPGATAPPHGATAPPPGATAPPPGAARRAERPAGDAPAPSGGDPGLPGALAPACADLAALAEAVAGCRACALCESRSRTVVADGTGRARVMFVGEAPGAAEDARGVPFVGPAGQLLTDIITKGMKLAREDVYIANVLKCRPPDNRDPSPRETALCTPWLDRQIELVDPLVLIPLGRHAAMHVLGQEAPLGRLRGRIHEVGGRKVVPTYHPAYLLRSPDKKKECWQDIQLAMGILGLRP
jgi:uracil-DNA glycosylase family 4